MKKTVKSLLLAVLVISTVCVLTILAGAAEVVESGFVMKYSNYVADDSEENVLNDGTDNDVIWTLTDDGVLTISSTNSTEAKMNPAAGWSSTINYKARIPWYSHLNDITSIVVEKNITALNGANFFAYMPNCESITFKADSVKLAGGSMMFCNHPKLTSLKFEGADYSGFEGNIIDLRYFTGTSDQAFENSCHNMSVSVLMPYSNANPIKQLKVFCESTNVTFYVIENSLAAENVAGIKNNADNYDTYTQTKNRTPYTKNVTIKNYDLEALGTVTGGVEGKYEYSLNIATGALVILNKYESGWQQFDTHDAEWQTFKAAWGSFVKTATVAYFQKISFGGAGTTTALFAGMENLESVAFQSGQRMQNGKADTTSWFKGCKALKSITFGGTLVEGVCDFSGMGFNNDDSPALYLTNLFNGCESIKEVIFPNKELLTTVKANTFKGCTNLQKVTLLENITTIEDGAFADCPEVVLTVVEDSYAHTWAVDNDVSYVLFEAEVPATFYEGRFAEKNELTYYYDIETKVLTISGTGDVLEMDYTLSWNGQCEKDTNGDGIKEVVAVLPWVKLGFANDVKEVVIEAEITAVGTYMLSKLANCEKITIPATLTELGHGALAYNNALSTVAVAGNEAEEGIFDFSNITKLGAYAFDGALANVTPTIKFSDKLESFGTAKIAQKCAELTLVFDGEDAAKAAAGFIVAYKSGEYEGNADYCQNIVLEYMIPSPVVFEGHSVRYTDYNGLRFVYSIDMNVVALISLDDGKSLKEYGTVIGTVENEAAYGLELDAEGNTANEKIIKTVVYNDGEFVGKRLNTSTETKTEFAVALVNIPEEHYSTNFASCIYVVTVDAEGNENVEYYYPGSANIKDVATDMYAAGMFNEETAPIAMEIVNYGKEATEEPVAYAEKSYL